MGSPVVVSVAAENGSAQMDGVSSGLRRNRMCPEVEYTSSGQLVSSNYPAADVGGPHDEIVGVFRLRKDYGAALLCLE